MPTYKNKSLDTDFRYLMLSGKDYQYAKPGDTFQSYMDYSDATDIEVLDDEPYWNPTSKVENITFAGAETKTYSGAEVLQASKIQIDFILTCTVTVYFNDIAAGEVDILLPGQRLEQDLKDYVNSIILVSDGAGSCKMKLLKKEYL